MTPIELLSPARTADIGIEAVRHGADAVYVGGPGFGARAAAGNSVADIERLCHYAQPFGAKVYVTLNTILFDDELSAAESLVKQLYEAGADALIVQDWAYLKMSLPPIALHASTQTDITTPEKAALLEAAGFTRLVVARELSLREIRHIAETVRTPLEAFVHGALCVSYSGRCYASQHCFGRSANRGCCAQFCRLAFDLTDASGHTLAHEKHLLSLRDMNRSASLEEMMDAGVSSFKIEGRLKDVGYVKNVTAFYRRQIDEILSRRSNDFCRASAGEVSLGFTPDVSRSFNRGFTDYFLHGRPADALASLHTPKAIGPAVAKVKEVAPRLLKVALLPNIPPLQAGDGLCFLAPDGTFQGFRLNRVENGTTLFPATMPKVRPGAVLHRSLDHAMEQTLSRPTAERRLALDMTLRQTDEGFSLSLTDELKRTVSLDFAHPHQPARTSQEEAVRRTLSRLGNTIYVARTIRLELKEVLFIPASVLTGWRREALQALEELTLREHRSETPGNVNDEALTRLMPSALPYSANVSNSVSRSFHLSHGAVSVEPALELEHPKADPTVLMTCRHCIRRDLGLCLLRDGKKAREAKEPLFLGLPDGRRFPLRFLCKTCEMQVLAPQ
ncbi:MAG: U32 family peptidase [Alloprevotella sp.]